MRGFSEFGAVADVAAMGALIIYFNGRDEVKEDDADLEIKSRMIAAKKEAEQENGEEE